MNKKLEKMCDCQMIAHRGCWDEKVPENSMEAFFRAKNCGIAIELDIHLSKDNEIVVFHDYFLKRMCNKRKFISNISTLELKTFRLKNSNQTIPLFKDVLKVVSGKVPIFVEIKSIFSWKKLCDRLLQLLKEYKGDIEIHGFNRKALKYIREKGDYPIVLSCFKPKPQKSFVPDGFCANIKKIDIKKINNFPPIISWTINNKKAKEKALSCSIAYMANTKNIK